MANREQIGQKIKQQRKDKHLTQSQLSELTRINKTTISEIENGRFIGSFDIFERLLDAVGLQFDIVTKELCLPDWDELDDLFSQDDD